MLGPLAARAGGWTREEQALKAAFLYNFARFTEWPDDTMRPGDPLTICVVDDGGTLDALRQIVARRPSDEREVRLRSMPLNGPLTSCQILYVQGDDTRRDAEVIERVKDNPVLTVGDARNFASAGGVVRLFNDRGRVRFAVNLSVAHRSRLYISSRVLALGVVVKDEADGP
jgi:hypothetical protein